jgi:uncharacterized protein YwqG
MFLRGCSERNTEKDMDRASIQAAFKKAGLTRLLKDVDVLVRPAIRLLPEPVEGRELPLGSSQLGGIPDLPADVVWPEWKGTPQSFIAQIRLGDVQAYDVEHLLPQQGMLWFFYDARQETYGTEQSDAGGWWTLYRENDAQLQRGQFPEKLPSESHFRSCALSFASELTLPQQPALELPDLDWQDEEIEKYEDVLEDLLQADEHGSTRHRLLGHPDTLQDDMRLQCQLATHGITDVDDPRVAELDQGSLDWRLLLQIDSDEQVNMRWASQGMLYSWIKEDQMRTRHFENTWFILQSE